MRPDLLLLAASERHWADATRSRQWAKESEDYADAVAHQARALLHKEIALELRDLAARIGSAVSAGADG